MPSPVIDLGHHNATPGWNAIKASGVVGIIHKVTEGRSYVDPTYSQRAHDADAVGLLFLPHHFLHPGSISSQMDWFLAHSSPPSGGRIVTDYETDATLDELCDAVEYLCDIRPDLQINVYSGHTIKNQLGDTIRGNVRMDMSTDKEAQRAIEHDVPEKQARGMLPDPMQRIVSQTMIKLQARGHFQIATARRLMSVRIKRSQHE